MCSVLCFKPFKIPFSVSCGLYRDNERNKKTDLSCCKIQPGEIPWFRCPLQTAPVRTEGLFWRLSRPEKGLQKRVNLMQQTTNSDLSRHYLPRQLHHLILQEYLSGVKTARQLSEEHGIPMSTIHKMGQRWKAKNSCSFVSTPNPFPIMSRVTRKKPVNCYPRTKPFGGTWKRLYYVWKAMRSWEISSRKIRCRPAKKSAAGQSGASKKDTQE